MRHQHHTWKGLQTVIAAVKNLHAANPCHSLHCWESLCRSRGTKQALLNAGYSIICFTPKPSVTPHLVCLLLLTKRSKERRGSRRGAAAEPDGPTLPSLGIVSLPVTLVFLSPPAPLAPICTSLFLRVCHIVPQFSLPRQRCWCCCAAHSEPSRQRNGAPLDSMAMCLRGAEISQACFPVRAKLCAELSWEAPQRGPVQRSHHCSQALRVHRNSPGGDCGHSPDTLKVFLHSFCSPPVPCSCLPISQPGWILSLLANSLL